MNDLVSQWYDEGRLVPAPPIVKHHILRQYAQRFDLHTLVETGTLHGDTIAALQNDFHTLYSIELSDILYKDVCERFKDTPHIMLVFGDSSKCLPDVMAKLTEPALFWLDGHFSHGDPDAELHNIAKGEKEFPLAEELHIVLSHHIPGHIILADDARYLGISDCPTFIEIQNIVEQHKPGWRVECVDDIVRIYDDKGYL